MNTEMSSKKSSLQHPKRDAEVREHLANERTLLAWVRTGVGLISVGFVVERAGALLAALEKARALPAGMPAGSGSAQDSQVFGLLLVALGVLALIIGAVQFFRSRRSIVEGNFAPTVVPQMIIVAGSIALGVAFIVSALL